MQKNFRFVLIVLAVCAGLLAACGPLATQPSNNQAPSQPSNNQELSQPPSETPEQNNAEQPKVATTNVNPNDYWVSDSEYDLIGFMEACGYNIPDGMREAASLFHSNEYESDRIMIAFYYRDSYSELHINVVDPSGQYSTIAYTLTDYDPTLETGSQVCTRGDLVGSNTLINKDSLLVYLEVIPQVKQKISEGHCPFNDTIGGKLSHTEQRRETGNETQHYSYDSGERHDFGTCY